MMAKKFNVTRIYNFFNEENVKNINNIITSNRCWVFQSSLNIGEKTFLQSFLTEEEISLFINNIENILIKYGYENKIELCQFQTAYINCHPANHPGSMHSDYENEGITILYYPDMGVDFENEGGTIIDEHGYEKYVPNSVLIFPGHVEHMAENHTVKGKYRYSVAFKFDIVR